MTQEQFYKNVNDRCECVRSGEYTLSGEYTGIKGIYTLTDKDGFEFKVVGGSLYRNIRPIILSCTNPTEYIKHKFKETHGDRYNYDKVVYNGSDEKVLVTCSIHGEFWTDVYPHAKGCGCPKCGAETTIKKRSSNKDKFVESANIKHNNKYNYDKFVYVNNTTKGVITCPIHNSDFLQTPNNHLSGYGCTKCGIDRNTERNTKSKEWFVEKATEVHAGKYTYDNVVYTKAHDKVSITCPIHGIDFVQKPSMHLRGNGCPKCRLDNMSKFMIDGGGHQMSYTVWANMGNKSKVFDSFKVYVAVCSSDNESFVKIGKTYRTIHKRFQGIPYEYNIHDIIIKDDPIEVCEIEQEIKKNLRGYRYKTQKSFGGQHECFNIDVLHSGVLDELIKNYN